jgi:ParB/RepB/Spo0J family partition protein
MARKVRKAVPPKRRRPEVKTAPTQPPAEDSPRASAPVVEPMGAQEAAGELVTIDARLIDPNPRQPRQHFDLRGLESLAQSILEGLLHRPIVRRAGDRYQIVYGERRVRSMRDILRWEEIPVDVRIVDDSRMLILALRENRDRLPLSGMEEARAAADLRDLLEAEGKLATHEVIAREFEYRSIESARQLLLIADRIDREVVAEIEAELSARGVTVTDADGTQRQATIHDVPKAQLLEIAHRDVNKAVRDSVQRVLSRKPGRPAKHGAAAAREAQAAARRLKAAERFIRALIPSGAPSGVAVERLSDGGIALAIGMDPERLNSDQAEALLAAMEPVRKAAMRARRRWAREQAQP